MFELIDTHPDSQRAGSRIQAAAGISRRLRAGGAVARTGRQARGNGMRKTESRGFMRGRSSGLELNGERLRIDGTEFSSRTAPRPISTPPRPTAAMLVAVSAGRECEEKARATLAGGQTGRIFFHGNVWLGGGRASGDGGQRPHLRLGRPERHGGPAALQSGLFRLGHGRPDQTVGIDPANERAAIFPANSKCWTPGCCGQKNRCWRCSASRGIWTRCGIWRHWFPAKTARCRAANIAARRTGIRRRKSKTCAGSRPGGRRGPTERHQRRPALDHRREILHQSPSALRKWSQERLQLNFLADGSVEARFRYEGTTCSNMGPSAGV